MNLKTPFPAPVPPVAHLGRPRGPKAFFLEPLLVMGASLLWILVLPLGGIVWLRDILGDSFHPPTSNHGAGHTARGGNLANAGFSLGS